MSRTVQDCYESKPLPAIHPNPKILKVTELSVICVCCGAPTADVRGDVHMHSACMEIVAGGVCAKCNVVTWSRTRLYPEHFLAWKDQGVMKGLYSVSWWSRIRKFVAWLLGTSKPPQ